VRVGGARGAWRVGLGIFASKVVGLVRDRAFAHYLGSSEAAGAFRAALRIPNFLQNLLGEGVLAASFIPVYARLLAEGRREEAERVAGAVFGLLALATSVTVALGVWASPALVDVMAPGFEGDTRALTIQLVRVLFPGLGVLVLSAWCLGVLNSHGRFFLSYAAPVVWNLALVGTLLIFGRATEGGQLAIYLAWGAVVGGLLQLGVQLPEVSRVLGRFRPSASLALPSVRQVLKSFGPVVLSRGVVQVSAIVDGAVASLISVAFVARLGYAQTLYLIPVSLFGMSVSAAELPEMSRSVGREEEIAARVRERLGKGLSRIAFLVVPSSVAFLLLGDVVAGALFQTGDFGADDTRHVWYLLMGSTVGLLAATQGRLYASAFYALKDTRTPLRFAALRVATGALLAVAVALWLPRRFGWPEEVAAAGLTAASGTAAWIEFWLLRRGLGKRIGEVRLPAGRVMRLWAAAVVGAAVAVGLKVWLLSEFGAAPAGLEVFGGQILPQPALPALRLWGTRIEQVLVAGALLVPFGLTYLGVCAALGVPESQGLVRRVLRRG
jgi:putative peptidoglycan lipid II flippase